MSEQKKIYHFDPLTGVYVGEGFADPSPLEPGEFIIPAHATDIAPPDELDGYEGLFFRGDHWAVEWVPELDANLDGQQDAPQGFAPDPERPGIFARLVKLVKGA